MRCYFISDSGNTANNVKEIHITALIPFIYNDRFGYKNAVDMATDDINNRSDILKRQQGSGNTANNAKEIHIIIALIPFIYSDRFGYKNAVDMTTDDVNNRSNILKAIKLKYILERLL